MKSCPLPLLLIAIFTCATARGQQYTIQSLGSVYPFGINNSTQITAQTFVDGVGYTSTVILANDNLTTIQPPAGVTGISPYSINNLGQIVIVGRSDSGVVSSIWDQNTGYSSISAPADDFVGLEAINNLGQVGGYIGSNGRQAAVWLSPQTPTILPYLSTTDTAAEVFALNDIGQSVGQSGFPISSSFPTAQAVLWQNGTITPLAPSHSYSEAIGINNVCQVIGYYRDGFDFNQTPFVWDATNGLTTLPTNGAYGDPAAINQEGQIVGQAYDSMTSVAALWQNGTYYDLNALLPINSGWVLESADGINDQGQIVGWGVDNGVGEGFMLTPIPEATDTSLVATIYLLKFSCKRKR